jgi:hypothetical protein
MENVQALFCKPGVFQDLYPEFCPAGMRADQSDFLASLFDGNSPRTFCCAELLAQYVSMQQASLTRFASTTLNFW